MKLEVYPDTAEDDDAQSNTGAHYINGSLAL